MLNKKRTTTILLVAVLILVIVLIGFFVRDGKSSVSNLVERARKISQPKASPIANQAASGAQIEIVNIPKDLPKGVTAVNLKLVGASAGKATVLKVSEGENFVLLVEAILPDLPSGQNYAGWLATSSSDRNPMSLGKLEKNDEKFTLSFDQNGDYSKYKVVIITSETNDDNKPETRLLEGTILDF